MNPVQHAFTSPADGTRLATYAWGDEINQPRGVVQIAHGIAEHSLRYDRLAQALTAAGYRVRAMDHRGHGKSVASAQELGNFGEPGFLGLVTDMAALGAQIAQSQPDLPLFLLGHSMGSIAAQHVVLDYSSQYTGLVLSGSTAVDVMAQNLASAANDEPIGLEAFNAAFEPRTGYEWLSRDAAEVDKYVADPLCGFDLPDDALPQLFTQMDRLADAAALGEIRANLPIFIISGDADPLAGGGQLAQLLGQRYRDAGVGDVSVNLYPGARHEIFNEINRDQITADVVAWLNAHS